MNLIPQRWRRKQVRTFSDIEIGFIDFFNFALPYIQTRKEIDALNAEADMVEMIEKTITGWRIQAKNQHFNYVSKILDSLEGVHAKQQNALYTRMEKKIATSNIIEKDENWNNWSQELKFWIRDNAS